MPALTLFMALVLAACHLFTGRFERLAGSPRPVLLSFAGGVSVAYITVHLLPEFQEAQDAFNRELGIPAPYNAYSLYLAASLGFLVFFALYRRVTLDRASEEGGPDTRSSVFAAHMAAFAVYNMFLGYYLAEHVKPDAGSILIFTAVIGLHLIANDVGLRSDHRKRYDPIGSRLLAAAVMAGWLTGYAADVPEPVFGLWFSLLAGGILINTIREELPKERQARIWPFALGIAIASAGLTLL